MIPIYWINLSKRFDRRYSMTVQLQNHINIRITPIKDKILQVSCAKSHHEAILTAWYDKCDYAIICEDDVLDITNIYNNPLIKDISSNKYNHLDWDIIQLHYICPDFSNGVLKLVKSGQITENCLLKGYLMSAACYIINRKGMTKFLSNTNSTAFQKWLQVDSKPMSYKEQKAHPLYAESKLEAVFYENSIIETFLYNYVNTYFCLIPLLLTKEENASDVGTALNVKWNYDNMIILQEIFKHINVNKLPFSDKIYEMPDGMHWSINAEEKCYDIIKKVLNK
jgi:hypothetical protein